MSPSPYSAGSHLFQAVFDRTTLGIAILDADLVIRRVNPVCCDLLSYEAGELFGKPWTDVLHPADTAAFLDKCKKVLAGDIAAASLEQCCLRKEDEPVRGEVHILPVQALEENSLSILLQFDVSQGKVTERALCRSREHLAEAQRISKLGSWEMELADNRLYWSDEIYLIAGIDPAKVDMGYEIFLDVVHPNDREIVNNAYLSSLENHNAAYSIEYRLLMPDGEVKWVQARCETLYDADGTPLKSIGTIQDISEYKKMEDELLYQQRKFRTLPENSPQIIMRYDTQCHCIYVNRAFTLETDMAVGSVLPVSGNYHCSVDRSLPPEKFMAHIKRVMETGEPAEVLIDWPRADTSEQSYYIFNIVAEYQPDGRLVGALVIGNNITTLKNTEKRLEESYAQLQRLSDTLETIQEEERKRIAQDMHDELGQYLTGLRMEVSMLRMRLDESCPEIMQHVHELATLVDKTIHVVHDIAASMRPAVLDMGITSSLEWLAKDFSRHTGVPCKLHRDNSEIILDDRKATTIFRIAQESLTNVARHARASQADIRLHRRSNNIFLEISDNGKGFNEAVKDPKSFGLLGMRERTAKLGGEIAITSKPGEGTRVTLSIPCTRRKKGDD